MKYEKCVTINLGNYQSLKIGVSEANSFADCDKVLIEHLENLGHPVDKMIKKSLMWEEK